MWKIAVRPAERTTGCLNCTWVLDLGGTPVLRRRLGACWECNRLLHESYVEDQDEADRDRAGVEELVRKDCLRGDHALQSTYCGPTCEWRLRVVECPAHRQDATGNDAGNGKRPRQEDKDQEECRERKRHQEPAGYATAFARPWVYDPAGRAFAPSAIRTILDARPITHHAEDT